FQVQKRCDLSRPRIDTQDQVGMPYIRPDLTFNELQFIQVRYRLSVHSDGKLFDRFECLRIVIKQIAATVTQDQILAVEGKTPSFSVVAKLLKQLEAFLVIHKCPMRLPRELNQPRVYQRKPFGEELRVQPGLLQHLS